MDAQRACRARVPDDAPASPGRRRPARRAAARGLRRDRVVRSAAARAARPGPRPTPGMSSAHAARREPVRLGHQEVDADGGRPRLGDAVDEPGEQRARPGPLAVQAQARSSMATMTAGAERRSRGAEHADRRRRPGQPQRAEAGRSGASRARGGSRAAARPSGRPRPAAQAAPGPLRPARAAHDEALRARSPCRRTPRDLDAGRSPRVISSSRRVSRRRVAMLLVVEERLVVEQAQVLGARQLAQLHADDVARVPPVLLDRRSPRRASTARRRSPGRRRGRTPRRPGPRRVVQLVLGVRRVDDDLAVVLEAIAVGVAAVALELDAVTLRPAIS